MTSDAHQPVVTDLLSRWHRIIPGGDDVFGDLVRRWGAPDRHYHNLQHLSEALAALDVLGGGRPERLAVWFHDAVYGLGAGADERASADLASARLGSLLVTPDDLVEVVRLVLLTEHHLPRPGDEAGARVSDCDMAILAADPGRYDESVRGIRLEYARYDDEAFTRGRIAVLDDFLSRPRLFHTARGHALWEARARANLARELRSRRRDA